MIVKPKHGMDDVPFGMSRSELLSILGQPVAEQSLNDNETHPKSRTNLCYTTRGFLVTPELGVIGIELYAEQTPIELWGSRINDMSPDEFSSFLDGNHCTHQVSKPDGWGDQDVESVEFGFVASFVENKLESFDVFDNSWRSSKAGTG